MQKKRNTATNGVKTTPGGGSAARAANGGRADTSVRTAPPPRARLRTRARSGPIPIIEVAEQLAERPGHPAYMARLVPLRVGAVVHPTGAAPLEAKQEHPDDGRIGHRQQFRRVGPGPGVASAL